ncbi:ABC transporter permease [Roseivirga sp.]|uniref:ABC transporter permease n=1 Tax=Roseivirga sp. TaxID=1964215 RepID=UPI002B26745C|nr:ABC transporter permease [Roseivirga sp.]
MNFINLKFTLRFLWRNKFFTLLNLLGLTLGITASIWLMLYLKNELSYDQYHVNADRVYRFSHHIKAPGVEFNTAFSANELPPMLAEEFPEIETFARFSPANTREITFQNETFRESDIFYTDPDATKIFTLDFEEGNAKSALAEPLSTIISKDVSQRLFGDGSAINQIIEIDGRNVKVTGVFKNQPENTHFKFQVLVSGVAQREFAFQDGVFNSEALWNPDCANYILMRPGFDKAKFLEKFKAFNEKYYMPFGRVVNGEHFLRIQKLVDIHYDTVKIEDDFPKGNSNNLVVFTIIGLSILFLACINYINLSTARAGLRAREIGIRKVLGSDALSLRMALLFESVVQVSVALILSVITAWLLIEYSSFQSLLGVGFSFNLFAQPDLIGLILLLVICTGLISGLYPALYLAKIKPVKALKGNWVASRSGNWVRRGLVLFQFIISIGVLTGTLLMKDQLNFLQNKELGYDKDQILVINSQDSLTQTKFKVLKEVFEQNPQIEAVSSSDFLPGTDVGQTVFMVEKDGEMHQQEFKTLQGDANYLETFGMSLKEGRFYRGDETRGNAYFVVNETAARMLNWEDPIDKKMGFFHQEEFGRVIGVVNDFNFFSLHNPIEPLVIVFNNQPGSHLIVRFRQGNEENLIAGIKSTWEETILNYPLDYSFLNQSLRDQYEADKNQNTLITSMSILCIFVSLIGLSGLSAFNVNQRRKEIGIRKVLGAMTRQIIQIIFSDTLKIIVLAGVISAPISYFIIKKWAENFAYQAPVSVFSMVISVIVAILLTLSIVSIIVWYTSRKNPSETLRYE